MPTFARSSPVSIFNVHYCIPLITIRVHNLGHVCYIVLMFPSKNERVLFHFNGHGVPKPTSNGEIWFFNKVRNSQCVQYNVHCVWVRVCVRACVCVCVCVFVYAYHVQYSVVKFIFGENSQFTMVVIILVLLVCFEHSGMWVCTGIP